MVKMIVDTDEVYTPQEVAGHLGKGIATVWRWIYAGKLVSVKVSGRVYIPKTEVDKAKK